MNLNNKINIMEIKLVKSQCTISNVFALEKIGAGHDGVVYRYQDLAFKILKYDIANKKEKNLMSFDKANYFMNNFDLQRITNVIDIILTPNNRYAGYVMPLLYNIHSTQNNNTILYKSPSDFSLWYLVEAINELEEDFNQLTKQNIIAKDINKGSYIFTPDFMYLCDIDKYFINYSNLNTYEENVRMLNFAIAKFILYEMQNSEFYNKNNSKLLYSWVKKACNSQTFLKDTCKEIGCDWQDPIKVYIDYKVKKLTR